MCFGRTPEQGYGETRGFVHRIIPYVVMKLGFTRLHHTALGNIRALKCRIWVYSSIWQHTRAHAQTHTHTNTNTNTNTQTHKHTSTQKHKNTKTQKHANTQTQTHARTHARTYARTHTHTRQELILHRICRELNPIQAKLD